MKLTAKLICEINSMDYETMLRKWRRSPSGEGIFQGESGEYFGKVMRRKGNDTDTVATSKSVGW